MQLGPKKNNKELEIAFLKHTQKFGDNVFETHAKFWK